MKVAIMQPYFFPYIGYFSLIKNTERFILFDSVQFIRHGWIERNRILKPSEGVQYISIPLQKHKQKTLIKDIKINNLKDWKNKILWQLKHYKKCSPFYYQTQQVIEECFQTSTDSITEFNASTLKSVCNYLNIPFNYEIFSQMILEIEPVNAPDEWALNICKALGYIDEYWNPPGGKELFHKQKYDDAGINLLFHNIVINKYSQRRPAFEPRLSIVDVMMFNSPEQINAMIDNYNFL